VTRNPSGGSSAPVERQPDVSLLITAARYVVRRRTVQMHEVQRDLALTSPDARLVLRRLALWQIVGMSKDAGWVALIPQQHEMRVERVLTAFQGQVPAANPLCELVVPLLPDRLPEVLALLADGLSRNQIAARMGITPAAVKRQTGVLLRLFGARTATHAVHVAHMRGVLPLDESGKDSSDDR